MQFLSFQSIYKEEMPILDILKVGLPFFLVAYVVVHFTCSLHLFHLFTQAPRAGIFSRALVPRYLFTLCLTYVSMLQHTLESS